MRRPTSSLSVLAVLAALLLGACGGGAATTGAPPGPAGNTAGAKASSDVYAQIAALPKDQQRAKAEELAKKEGALSIYTSMTQDVANAIAKAFEEQYGIKTSVFRGNSETVLQRITQEAQANRLGADAVETNFVEMAAMSDQGVLQPYTGTAVDKVTDKGRFTNWTATRFNIFQPAWNTNLIKPGDEPTSWESLADPKYKGKITVELSDSDWFAAVTQYWLANGKSQQQVDDLWKKIVANSKVAKGHTTMMQLLGAGQTPMNAMNYTYITYRAAQKGAPVAYLPASGTSTIPAFPRPNGVGMLKGAKNPAAAWLFYDWLLSDGQKVIVKQGLTPSTKVAGDKSLDGITLAPFPIDELRKNGATWAKKFDELLRGVEQIKK